MDIMPRLLPNNFQLDHITSNPIEEPEVQIRYHNGNIEHISKEDAFNRLLTENPEEIMKISWHYDKKLMRCGIVKGEDIPKFVVDFYNIKINPSDYYCMITNFSYNPFTMPKTEGKAYYEVSDDYAIEVWNVYKIKTPTTESVIEI
jgi:hypothetical protein